MDKRINDLQMKLLVMFKWFHNFCEQNNLRYYALGGTMLGAARHKGFIPWDDDIDVGMPRKDYERFLSLTKGKKIDKYVVEDSESGNKDYFYGYAKVYDTSTTLIEKTRTNLKRGIFIDVFPLDGVSNSEEDILRKFKPIYYRYQLIVAQTCAIVSRRSFYKNVIISIARLIPNYKNRVKKQLLYLDKLCSEVDFDSCKIVGNYLGNWGLKEIMPKDYFGKPTLYKFEDISIYGVEQYDEYLTALYNDWRTLPPIEKQISIHDNLKLDLNESYIV